MNKFWKLVWNLSEKFNIDLGQYAPYVFGKMIGSKGKLIDYPNEYPSEQI
jgi:hypothetical protein